MEIGPSTIYSLIGRRYQKSKKAKEIFEISCVRRDLTLSFSRVLLLLQVILSEKGGVDSI